MTIWTDLLAPARTPVRLAVMVAALCAVPLCFVTWKTTFGAVLSDIPIYLLQADYLSPWYDAPRWTKDLFGRYPFPPLYPLFLGILGGGTANPLWTHLIGGLTLVAATGVFAYWLTLLRWPAGAVALAAGLFAILPISIYMVFGSYSEPLYVLLTVLAFAALERDNAGSKHWALAAALIGLSAVTRTVGVTAIGAFMIVWWLRTRGTAHRSAPFIVLIPSAVWAYLKWRFDFDSSYVLFMIRIPLSDTIPAIVAEIPNTLAALFYHSQGMFDRVQNPLRFVLLPMVLGLIIFGWLARLRTGSIDAIYCLAYISLLAIWPHGNHAGRFLFCLLPCAILYLGSALTITSGSRMPAGLARFVPLALFAALALPSVYSIFDEIRIHQGTPYSNAVRAESWFDKTQKNARYESDLIDEMFSAIEHLAGQTEPEACITSVYPYFVMLVSQRNSYYPAAPRATDVELEHSMRHCPYVLIMNATNDIYGFDEQYYPYFRIEDFMEVIDDVYYHEVEEEPVVAAILARYLKYEDTASN